MSSTGARERRPLYAQRGVQAPGTRGGANRRRIARRNTPTRNTQHSRASLWPFLCTQSLERHEVRPRILRTVLGGGGVTLKTPTFLGGGVSPP